MERLVKTVALVRENEGNLVRSGPPPASWANDLAPIAASDWSYDRAAHLIDRAGFVPAMMVLVFGSAMAGSEFKFLEVLLFSVFLTALGVIIFIWGLGLPYPLIADFQ